MRKMTKLELFDEIYKELWSAKKSVKRKVLREKLAPYFKSEETLNGYIEEGLERKRKNMVARRIRIKRKANLADFNFFVTVTYFYGHSFITVRFIAFRVYVVAQ